ncbi:MAG: RNA-directed DNA polymerase [Planctomycetaceae bacterium]|nr:MAG: RNA-directed DNA polymerase [Planctomycetaceae bacterium]
MGFFDWVFGWLGLGLRSPAKTAGSAPPGSPGDSLGQPGETETQFRTRNRNYAKVALTPRTFRATRAGGEHPEERRATGDWPYKFARRAPDPARWLDLSRDADRVRLAQFGLPVLETPEDLARWLQVELGELAWLSGHFHFGGRPDSVARSHYHYSWIEKRSGGRRLIEAPKARLKHLQTQILRCILDRVPPHRAAHGFVAGRSILSNAAPHVGQRVLVQFDLSDFYPSVSYSRVVAIFRSLGFSREVGCWLARLTTSAVPHELLTGPSSTRFGSRFDSDHELYLRRHLPQGAPTSPALANLSAFVLDLRLAGLARAFQAHYTRYADDLTFSGGTRFQRSLAVFIPLARQIIRGERFSIHPLKFRVRRRGQRQTVTGVVVNDHLNVSRADFDRLKAILHNCARHGPASQNRSQLPDFAGHLRGRIAHVQMINPRRAAKLVALFGQIDWTR